MREIMLAATLLGAAALLAPAKAEAQTWRDQLGVPGDFRCDAYWDRGRDDCDAAWRTQYLRQGRDRWSSHGRGDRHDGYRGYDRYASYGHGYSQGYGHGQGYGGYGGYGYGWPHEPRPTHAPTPYRDPERIHWCQHQYRSYDPYTGYYLGYSGRYRFCG